MKKSNRFIIVLCLLVAALSLVVAFGPMIKNLKPADETTVLPDGSDISSDLNDSDDVSSDVPGGGSSDLPDDSGSSDLPDDSGSSDLSDDSGSSELPDDSGSSELPEDSSSSLTLYVTRNSESGGTFRVNYTSPVADPVEESYENPGTLEEETCETLSYLTINLDYELVNDYQPEITLDFSNFGYINVYDENMELIFDGGSISEGVFTFEKGAYSVLYVVGIYN